MPLRPRFAFLTLLLASGCTVGPDFVAPAPNTPASWSATQVAQPANVVSTAAPDTAWWHSFNDSELESLIARAAESNLTLKQAAIRIAEARSQREVAGARDLPRLGLDNSYTRSRISPNGALSLFGGGGGGSEQEGGSGAANAGAFPAFGSLPPFGIFQSGFDATWEIDLFGKVRRSVESADAQAEATIEDRNDMLLAIYAEVARDYIQLRGLQKLIAVTESNLAAQRQAYDLTRAQQEGGQTSRLDVESAAAEVATTEAQLPTLQDQKTRTINALSRLLGREPGALQAELDSVKPIPAVRAAVPIGLPSELARRRPDIRRAEADLHVATANIGVAVADLYPRVSLFGQVGVQALKFDKLGDWASHFYNFGPSLSIPIFNGTTYATISLEEGRQQEAALVYENTVLGALHDVENAVSTYGAEQVRFGALQRAATANRNSVSLAQQRYKAGLSSFLEVLDAERRLYASEIAAANSEMAISTGVVAVYKALGGGWDIAQPGATQTVAVR